MRSLQILTPARPCMFDCPFCIAKSHDHQNHFENAYATNFSFWKTQLTHVIQTHPELKTVVITGTNEPLQDPNCVEQIIAIVRKTNPDLKIELQTRFYAPLSLMDDCDVVAYSIASPIFFNKISVKGKISRYVILLTDQFAGYSLDQILAQLPREVTQLTFKVLHDSQGFNSKMDDWISKHRLPDPSFFERRNKALSRTYLDFLR